MGVSRYLKEQNPDVKIVGLQPSDGSKIAGIRRWPIEYRPEIFDPSRVDVTLDIDQLEAEEMARQLAVEEGVFCGVSAGGAVSGALRVARELPRGLVVCIICDRGDRYLSTDLFPDESTYTKRAPRRKQTPDFPIRIDKLSHEGRGLAQWGERIMFVDGALPGNLSPFE